MKLNLRKTLFNTHLYAGLVIGLFLFSAALSGTILAFRPEWDPAVNLSYWHLSPLPQRAPLDQLVRRARQEYPQSKIDYVQFSPAADAAAVVRYADREELFLDPYRLSTLRMWNKETEFFYTVEKLHRYLFLGKSGQWITGSVALALAVMAATGIYLWWPRGKKGASAGFVLNRQLKGRAWNVNLHKVVGIYSALLLAVSSLTGAADFLNWLDTTYFTAASTRSAGRALRSAAPLESKGGLSYQAVWDIAQQAIGPYQFARIGWPKTKAGPLQVVYVAEGAPHDNELSYLFIDGYNGRVLRSSPYANESAASRFYMWLRPIHEGMIGGWFGRALVVSGALSTVLLSATGYWLYYRRKLNPVRRAAAPAARAAVAAVP